MKLRFPDDYELLENFGMPEWTKAEVKAVADSERPLDYRARFHFGNGGWRIYVPRVAALRGETGNG